jgi:UDP-N-acetylmuramyl pentapeptide phosphotransferase/UDP-N-acetylglucosamine-1-phosphate transferase
MALFYKLPLSFYVSLCVSFLICLFIIKTKKQHRIFTSDSTEGVQKLHSQPTPRIGGLSIFIAVVCAYFAEITDRDNILGPLILAGLFAFIFGLAEDLTKRVSVSTRLLATITAGIVGWLITGVSISHLGLPFIDPIFKNQFFSVLFTAIAIGGMANAINMIDGLNGLASFMLIISLATVSMIAHSVGDVNLAIASLVVSGSILGFFLVNWPWGKLFLGDGGSYFGGFALAWCCLLLTERNVSVSPFAALLVCIYPFTEALFSVYRRRKKLSNLTRPDAQHLHSLIYRRYFATLKININHNSIAGLIVGGLSVPPALCAYLFWMNKTMCMLSVVFFMGAYVLMYSRIIKFRWI